MFTNINRYELQVTRTLTSESSVKIKNVFNLPKLPGSFIVTSMNNNSDVSIFYGLDKDTEANIQKSSFRDFMTLCEVKASDFVVALYLKQTVDLARIIQRYKEALTVQCTLYSPTRTDCDFILITDNGILFEYEHYAVMGIRINSEKDYIKLLVGILNMIKLTSYDLLL